MAAPPRPTKAGSKPYFKGQTDDLASLAALDESILLEELHVRYQADQVYVRGVVGVVTCV
jgi:myosin heavy subunit